MRNALISIVVLASSVAFAQTPPSSSPSMKGQGGAGMQQNTGIELPKDEKSFAERLQNANEMEIRLGKLAQQKGQSQAVKDYGKMMVDDHTQANQELTTLAKQQKWTLSKPRPTTKVDRAMMDAHKATEQKLQALDGMAFDTAYMAAMVEDHDMVITKVTMATQQFANSPMTPMLTRMLPKLQTHRDDAYRILGEVKANPSAMGVGGAGSTGGSMDQGHMNHDMNKKGSGSGSMGQRK